MSDEQKRKIRVPDGWQPRFEPTLFPGLYTMTLTDTRRTWMGNRCANHVGSNEETVLACSKGSARSKCDPPKHPDEYVTEAEAHFALSKLLERRDEVDAAITNMRAVLSAFATPEDRFPATSGG